MLKYIDLCFRLQCEFLAKERDQLALQLRSQRQQLLSEHRPNVHHNDEQTSSRNAHRHPTSPVQNDAPKQRIELLMLLPPKMWTVEQVAEWIESHPPSTGIPQCASVGGRFFCGVPVFETCQYHVCAANVRPSNAIVLMAISYFRLKLVRSRQALIAQSSTVLIAPLTALCPTCA